MSRQKQILTRAYDYARHVLSGPDHLSSEYMLKLALMSAPSVANANAALAAVVVAVTSVLFSSCGANEVNTEIKPGGGTIDPKTEITVKNEPVTAKSQYITIVDENTIRLSNYGSTNSFDILLSNRLEDQPKGVAVKTNYRGDYNAENPELNISEIIANKGGYKVILKTANFKFSMTADTPWLLDEQNNAYKSVDSRELLLQRIDVLNVPDKETAIQRINRLTNNELIRNAAVLEVVKGGNDKNIIADGLKLKMTN